MREEKGESRNNLFGKWEKWGAFAKGGEEMINEK